MNKQTNGANFLKPLLIWFSISLSASIIFMITASQEISKRTFPQSDPFFSDVQIKIGSDIFLPTISTPIVLFGIFAGLIVYIGYKWFSYHSTRKGNFVGIIALILLSIMLWFGIQSIVYIIQFKWVTLYNADLLGIEVPKPEYYQLVIWVVGTIVFVCAWFSGRETIRSRSTP